MGGPSASRDLAPSTHWPWDPRYFKPETTRLDIEKDVFWLQDFVSRLAAQIPPGVIRIGDRVFR